MSCIQEQDSPLIRKAIEDIQSELRTRLRKPLQIVASHGYETVQIHTSVEDYEMLRIAAIVWPDYPYDGPIVLKASQQLVDPDGNKYAVNPKLLASTLLDKLRKIRQSHAYL